MIDPAITFPVAEEVAGIIEALHPNDRAALVEIQENR